MDKWTELRETIQELHENNPDKTDVENVTRFLLNLMNVIDAKCEKETSKTETISCRTCPYFRGENKLDDCSQN